MKNSDYTLLSQPDFDKALAASRLQIAEQISKAIGQMCLTHAKVAEITGFGRTVITAIVNKRLQQISTDRLLKVAYKLGLRIHFRVW